MEPKVTTLAREAYARYAAVTDNKNYQGLPMPEFDALSDTIRRAWEAAVEPLVAAEKLEDVAKDALATMIRIGHRDGKSGIPEAKLLCEAVGEDWDEFRKIVLGDCC